MRIVLIFIIVIFVTSLKAQIPFGNSFQNSVYGSSFRHNRNVYDSNTQKKWFLSRYSGITAGYGFFSHGNAGFLSAPTTLQLNRRLNNNLYAFAGATVAPMYLNFNRAFINTDLNKINKGNGIYQPGSFTMYSAATLGLMYINNEKTFSVSGSISIERNNYPLYYGNQFNAKKPVNTNSSFK